MMLRRGTHFRNARRVCLAVPLCAVASLFPSRLSAQSTLSGVVTDTTGAPVFSARITVEGTDASASTDIKGRFYLVQLPAGLRSVSVTRIGFSPFEVLVRLENAAEAEVSVRMTPVVASLPSVTVRAEKAKYSGRLAGYYKRLESKSGGHFITREQIDRDNPSSTGHMLSTIPAVQLVKGRGGITGIRLRGRRCWPLVWIDGMPMPAGEVDVDAFVPSSIQGIEIYLGATTAPMAYVLSESLNSCGTILIWSRGPDTEITRRASPPRAGFAEPSVQDDEVFTVDKVDRSAHLDSTHRLELNFPPALFASNTPGLVIAEFVVDTLGRVEPKSVGVVSASARPFAEAVRVALGTAHFVPAIKDGRPVRQLVQQPFEFRVSSDPGSGATVRQ